MDLSAASGQLVPTRARGDGWTPERQRAFLEALAECGSVTRAAARVGMSRESAYALRRRADARGFAQAWDAARALAVEHLTETAWNRALDGELRQVFYHGELVGESRHYDNRLLMALIAQNRLAAGPALASPELIAEVAADWDAALDRAERGEALAEPGQTQATEPADAPGASGDPGDAALELEIGLYTHWWDEAGERWLTNWPAPEHFSGAEFWVDEDGEVLGPHDPGQPEEEDAYGDLQRREWARELSDEELAGLRRAEAERDVLRASRIEQRRRTAFGLTAGRDGKASQAAPNRQ